MTCKGCSGAVERVLKKVPGKIFYVANIEIDLEMKRVFVTSTLSSDELLATIKKAGKEASYIGPA
ncbi:predicted protein [Nematostella vectensis]|uniref:Copper transport protein ATOX1 n=1 Tax=Nematostella vectensis TaxID=45351 RepID=A7S6X8_NEMVE|nr:predicted protein [Nematostella vectensis]|eukprot:XP_001632568.1 predicted protein [Nematostella vectensis]